MAGLIRLLRDDAVFEMPPLPTWYAGREPVGRFLAARVLRQPGDLRMIPAALFATFGLPESLSGPASATPNQPLRDIRLPSGYPALYLPR